MLKCSSSRSKRNMKNMKIRRLFKPLLKDTENVYAYQINSSCITAISGMPFLFDLPVNLRFLSHQMQVLLKRLTWLCPRGLHIWWFTDLADLLNHT